MAPGGPTTPSDPGTHARYLADLILVHFRIKLEPATVAAIRAHMGRVGPGNQADLISSIFLECLEVRQRGIKLTDEEVRRAADRVRQRLIREAERAIPTGDLGQAPAVGLPPDDEAEFVIRQFRDVLRQRSAQDLLLFQRYYLNNQRDVAALAKELGISPATVYRRLAAIRSDYLALRDLRQPPHAAD
jgi:hypothetical protein